MVGFYLYGQFGENEKIERTALLAAESFLVSGLFNSVLKVMMRRTRPFDGVSADTFDSSFTGNNSFPSGHTTTAFAIATVVANEYEKGAIKLLKAELNNLASVKWLDQPGSLSIINMYQEVIAAKFNL